MIRVFDCEGICIEEYESWEKAALVFFDMLNELEHEKHVLVSDDNE